MTSNHLIGEHEKRGAVAWAEQKKQITIVNLAACAIQQHTQQHTAFLKKAATALKTHHTEMRWREWNEIDHQIHPAATAWRQLSNSIILRIEYAKLVLCFIMVFMCVCVCRFFLCVSGEKRSKECDKNIFEFQCN